MRKTLSFLLILFLFSLANCQQTKLSPPLPQEQAYSAYTQAFQHIDEDQFALTHAKLIDGTGAAPAENQVILIQGKKILRVGPMGSIEIPKEIPRFDMSGKTVIPGIVGTHNHMRFPRGALLYSSPKLYLAAGVTTLQTCGTGNPVEEMEISHSIEAGNQPGPQIINSGPYFTGPEGKENFIRVTDEKAIRDTIKFWAENGVEWFKVYRNTRPQDLKVVIDEAHKYGSKVTGHLCATTYTEAAELGIDAIEHGFIHSYDHAEGKEPNMCNGSRDFRSLLDVNSEKVQQVHQKLIENNVALSSTLSIFETQAIGIADKRSLALLVPYYQEAYETWWQRKVAKGDDWYFKEIWLKKSMEYERAFFKAGGLLTAGPDPGLHNMPGYGDQKNYELFIEAGFTPVEAIKIMTSNGAKLLEKPDIGSVKPGMLANLVILDGDLEKDPQVIQQVETVIKYGKGYDPKKLLEIIMGQVGSPQDNDMYYFGQADPGLTPQIFAPEFISKPNQYEFGSVFSKDKTEFYYAIAGGGRSEILFSKLHKGVWSNPEVIISHERYGYNDPMLSPDEDRLYFISDQALDGKGEQKDHDIWYVEREGSGWSSPINAGPNINTEGNEYYMAFTDEGAMYFSSNKEADTVQYYNFDIYKSAQVNGEFQVASKLDQNVNTDQYEADVYVAGDESYVIFCSIREEGLGEGDLYISFRNKDGSWTKAKNMGDKINTAGHQLCPFVSKDGKYLFYTSEQDIYWVNAEIIESFRGE